MTYPTAPACHFLRALLLALFVGLSASLDRVWAQGSAEWMGNLPDETGLNRLSLPGAHDCATGNGFSGFSAIVGSSMGKTQDKTLAEQWDCGVRVFDLRPHLDGNTLRNYHGVLATKLLFDEALTTLCSKLAAHPSECAIVIFQEEEGSESTHNAWAQKVREILHSDALAPYVADYRPTLTLGDLRGKLLILARNDYGTTPVGAYLSGWSFSADISSQTNGSIKGASATGNFRVQDFYDVTEAGATDKKLDAITAMLELTQKNALKNRTLYINHTSGYTTSASTAGNRNNAQNCNGHLLQLLDDGRHSGPTGIIMMDFAGADKSGGYTTNGQALIDAVIGMNAALITGVQRISTNEDAAEALLHPSDSYSRNGAKTSSSARTILRNGRIIVESADAVFNIGGQQCR